MPGPAWRARRHLFISFRGKLGGSSCYGSILPELNLLQSLNHASHSWAVLIQSSGTCRWIYSSTLAYIVDANNGRSSTAVACNSSFRGIAGCVAVEVAVPLQVRARQYYLPDFYHFPSNYSPKHTRGFHLLALVNFTQDAVGDGWMYTIWAGLVTLSSLMIVLVMWKGGRWREEGEEQERRQALAADHP